MGTTPDCEHCGYPCDRCFCDEADGAGYGRAPGDPIGSPPDPLEYEPPRDPFAFLTPGTMAASSMILLGTSGLLVVVLMDGGPPPIGPSRTLLSVVFVSSAAFGIWALVAELRHR